MANSTIWHNTDSWCSVEFHSRGIISRSNGLFSRRESQLYILFKPSDSTKTWWQIIYLEQRHGFYRVFQEDWFRTKDHNKAVTYLPHKTWSKLERKLEMNKEQGRLTLRISNQS